MRNIKPMPTIKKVLFSLLLFLTLSVSAFSPLLARPAQAANNWYSQDFFSWYTKVYDTSNPQEMFGERYTAAQVQWVFYSTSSYLLNQMVFQNTDVLVCIFTKLTNTGSCVNALREMVNTFTGLVGLADSSNINPKSMMATIFGSQSISGVGYVVETATRFHIIPQAEAQGYGYSAAGTIRNLWRAARDISYMFMTIVVVALAFMIMFRIKLSPQTVITIQSALPKVVIALILITFSYAIAGFLIDIMYLAIGALSLMLSQSEMTAYNAQELFGAFANKANAGSLFLGYWLVFLVAAISSVFAGSISAAGLGEAVLGIVAVIIAIVSIVFLAWYSVKTMILIFKTYAMIILTIFIGPLEILAGIFIPGLGFGSWVKRLISNLAVFPIMALLFFLSFYFLAQGIVSDGFLGGAGGTSWLFPFGIIMGQLNEQSWKPPFVGLVLGENFIWLMVSFTIVGSIPKIAEIIQGLISGRQISYGNAIGEALSPVTGAAKGIIGTAQKGIGEGFWGLAKTKLPQPGMDEITAQRMRTYVARGSASGGGQPRPGGRTT